MTAADMLAQKVALFGDRPCCDVPLVLANPGCAWHGYRSLLVALQKEGVSEQVCSQAMTVETAAQVHALVFVRRTLIATAQEETANSYAPTEVMAKLVERLNQLIADLER